MAAGKNIPDVINPSDIKPSAPEVHNNAITPVIIEAEASTIATCSSPEAISISLYFLKKEISIFFG